MLAVFFSILLGMGADKPASRKDTTKSGTLPALVPLSVNRLHRVRFNNGSNVGKTFSTMSR
jgi:hypothetical protein